MYALFMRNGLRSTYGIKSESTPAGIVWHVMIGWKDDASSFATWFARLDTFADNVSARAALRGYEGRTA